MLRNRLLNHHTHKEFFVSKIESYKGNKNTISDGKTDLNRIENTNESITGDINNPG